MRRKDSLSKNIQSIPNQSIVSYNLKNQSRPQFFPLTRFVTTMGSVLLEIIAELLLWNVRVVILRLSGKDRPKWVPSKVMRVNG